MLNRSSIMLEFKKLYPNQSIGNIGTFESYSIHSDEVDPRYIEDSGDQMYTAHSWVIDKEKTALCIANEDNTVLLKSIIINTMNGDVIND